MFLAQIEHKFGSNGGPYKIVLELSLLIADALRALTYNNR